MSPQPGATTLPQPDHAPVGSTFNGRPGRQRQRRRPRTPTTTPHTRTQTNAPPP
ncbi:hypothetical protein [Dictyobacter halimunensis]|uniref:hypothetical protein n=1 Tax=Dictyobacter halimunensis TaxID=3026934 RepID=UPI0030C73FFF